MNEETRKKAAEYIRVTFPKCPNCPDHPFLHFYHGMGYIGKQGGDWYVCRNCNGLFLR
jgi:hypothetical protein